MSDSSIERATKTPPGGPFDDGFVTECVRQFDTLGQELYELPAWAWLRRRRALRWRQHYASRIADEMAAWRQHTMENL